MFFTIITMIVQHRMKTFKQICRSELLLAFLMVIIYNKNSIYRVFAMNYFKKRRPISYPS